MSLLTNIREVALNLSTFDDIQKLATLNKDFQKIIASPEFAKFYHYRKHNTNPPDVIYTPEKYPWRLEFSFLDPKFFFGDLAPSCSATSLRRARSQGDKLYFYPLGAYIDALRRRDRWTATLLESHFKIEISPGVKRAYLYSNRIARITREELEYLFENFPVDNEDRLMYYIRELANYGDIEYFEKHCSSMITSKEFLSLGKLHATNSQRNPEPDMWVCRRYFTLRMIEIGQDRLLEAYNKYTPTFSGKHHIQIYNPDQWKLPMNKVIPARSLDESPQVTHGLDEDRVYLLEGLSISYKELFSRIKEVWERNNLAVTAVIRDKEKFIEWLLKNHLKESYLYLNGIRPTYIIDKYQGKKNVTIGNCHYNYMQSAYQSEDSWEEITSYLALPEKDLRFIVTDTIIHGNYSRFFEILEWDEERVMNILHGYSHNIVKGFYELLTH